ncbi:OsmC family protein [Microbacterium thalli]|uniref:OsmC family protein n=1 Tax=Microbacterium thalli TaxID=3027921 RepID=UPI002366E607|nr:OsmC family protein [Microbacterium thalli]MDD7929707.1 OsmC family protein [Microbacterium thalli]
MTVRYRTSAFNDDGGTGVSRVPWGLSVAVSNPLQPDRDAGASNPEQLLALAWSTCLNATAQAIVRGAHRTAVRVDVEMRDAEARGGFEFVATAFVSGEGLSETEAAELATAAHDRCPVSRLLHDAPTVSVRAEAWASD